MRPEQRFRPEPPPGALASEPSDSDSNADFEYETDPGQLSDGDPPEVAKLLSSAVRPAPSPALAPAPHPSPAVVKTQPEPTSTTRAVQPVAEVGVVKVNRINRRKWFSPLEMDAWDSPESFYDEVAALVK